MYANRFDGFKKYRLPVLFFAIIKINKIVEYFLFAVVFSYLFPYF